MYHPVQDVNHCVYRILLLLEHTTHDEIGLDLYRLLDFYMLFPHLLKDIEPLPKELGPYKRLLKEIPAPFESMRNTKRIMHELESLQTAALHSLLAKQLINIEKFKSKLLQRTEVLLPNALASAIQSSDLAKKEWFRMVINDLPVIDFGGRKGLKKRSGLMEFRYDTESE